MRDVDLAIEKLLEGKEPSHQIDIMMEGWGRKMAVGLGLMAAGVALAAAIKKWRKKKSSSVEAAKKDRTPKGMITAIMDEIFGDTTAVAMAKLLGKAGSAQLVAAVRAGIKAWGGGSAFNYLGAGGVQTVTNAVSRAINNELSKKEDEIDDIDIDTIIDDASRYINRNMKWSERMLELHELDEKDLYAIYIQGISTDANLDRLVAIYSYKLKNATADELDKLFKSKLGRDYKREQSMAIGGVRVKNIYRGDRYDSGTDRHFRTLKDK